MADRVDPNERRSSCVGAGHDGWALFTREQHDAELRDAEIQFSAGPLPPKDERDREAQMLFLRSKWLKPALPAWGPRCGVCLTPARLIAGRCPSCRKLLKLHEIPMASLEFVTMASSDDRQHHLLGGWKDLVREDGLEHAPDHFLYRATVALSSYLEAQAPRLLAESPVITVVPTNASLIACALRIASQRGWFAPNVVRTGVRASRGVVAARCASGRTTSA